MIPHLKATLCTLLLVLAIIGTFKYPMIVGATFAALMVIGVLANLYYFFLDIFMEGS